MKFILAIIFIFTFYSFANAVNEASHNGPNCHLIHSAISADDGKSYRQIKKNLLTSASVPDAVKFSGKNFIY
tara:strand:+ start:268 stop:483 length:216 start_codon:yes stop_codon:yes gene_type:complete